MYTFFVSFPYRQTVRMIGLIADLNIFLLLRTPPKVFPWKKDNNLTKLQPFPLGCVHIPTKNSGLGWIFFYRFFFPFSSTNLGRRKSKICCLRCSVKVYCTIDDRRCLTFWKKLFRKESRAHLIIYSFRLGLESEEETFFILIMYHYYIIFKSFFTFSEGKVFPLIFWH